MAGKLIVDTIDTDNAFITLNVQQSQIATMNVSGIYSNTGVKMIGANGTVSNTAITGLVTASQIANVANTQITGNIASSQITSNPTFYGNVSVTGVIGVGGATPTSNGSGITFPATQSASSDANTLDDYEEGTFSSTLTASGSAPSSVTYSQQQGRYTKIGRLVQIEIYVRWTAYSGGSGNVFIGGLPFTAASAPFGAFTISETTGLTISGTYYSLVGEMNSSATTIGILKAAPSTATTSVTLTEVGTATTVYFILSGCYTTT
jgi:hypothetical protein